MPRFFSAIAESVLAARSTRGVVLICALWLAATAGVRPLMMPDEGRYVGVAWEMLNSGNWWVPTLDGLPFFHKPPLFYWLTALSLHVFGSNEWAGRLASVAAAIVTAAVLHGFLRRHVDQRTANLTVAVLATQPLFFVGAQYANLDMLVAAMISLTIVFAATAALNLERGLPYRAVLTASYLTAALGVLAKGLIGLLLPAAVIVLWLLLRCRLRLLRALLPISRLLLLLLLVVPWFGWMEKSYSGFWDYFFIYHHFQRFSEAGFNNPQPMWFYVPVLLLCALPWSLWAKCWFSRRYIFSSGRFEIRCLMLVWLVVVVVFFSLPSSKLIGYIFPAVPPLAYLLAEPLLLGLTQPQEAGASMRIGITLFVACLLCLLFILAVVHLDPGSSRNLAVQARPLFTAGDQLVMLDEYPYDLPFYLRKRDPSWVVSDWQAPDVAVKDIWRKELHDAGRFAPDEARTRLLGPGHLTAQICTYTAGSVWLWGEARRAARWPFLHDAASVFSEGKKSLWRLPRAADGRASFCAEMPSSG